MKKQLLAFFVIATLLLPQITLAGKGNLDRLRGKILLQVESKGEAWYVEPASGERAFLGRPADAFQVMREFGLGVSEESYNSFLKRVPEKMAGKIILRVESKGEAYYVEPENMQMNFLGRPADAFQVMRKQGLGISNDDLVEVPVNEKYQGLDQARKKVLAYINENLVTPGQEAKIKELSREGEMYKFIVKMSNGQEITSFANKELTKFFPQVMDMTKKKEAEKPKLQVVSEISTQTAVPKVELFVMSHCPYGLQIEKGFLPVLEALGETIDFELKNTDYAMHGEKEVDEQMWQYCIQDQGRDVLENYLECFVEKGDRETCLIETNIDSDALAPCLQKLEDDYAIKELYADKSTWKSGRFPQFPVHKEATDEYAVTGSPTLVINGEKIGTARDSQSLLNTICSAFETKPEECEADLSSTAPAPGFGSINSGSGSAADCGI